MTDKNKEYKITHETLMKMAAGCSTVKAALERGFPEAFMQEGPAGLIKKLCSGGTAESTYKAACDHLNHRPVNIDAFAYELPALRDSAYAQHQIGVISHAFNNGRKIDWSDKLKKWRVWVIYKSGVGLSCDGYYYDGDYTGGGAGLHFLDEEVVKYLKDQKWFIELLGRVVSEK